MLIKLLHRLIDAITDAFTIEYERTYSYVGRNVLPTKRGLTTQELQNIFGSISDVPISTSTDRTGSEE